MSRKKLISQGIESQSIGDFFAAEKKFRRALSIDPKNVETLHLLGNLRHIMGDNTEALNLLYQGFRETPNSPLLLKDLALILASDGQVNRSIQFLKTALKFEPEDVDLLNGLAIQLKLIGNISEAKLNLEKATSVNKDSFSSWYNLGNLCLIQDELTDAQHAFLRALQLSPKNIDVTINFAIVLVRIGSYSEAEKILTEALIIEPNNPTALNNLGNLYRQLGRSQKAIKCFKKAISEAPEVVDIQYNYGQALCDENRVQEARSQFSIVVAKQPSFIKAHWAEKLSLPTIYSSEKQILEERYRWKNGLKNITENLVLDSSEKISASLNTISELTNFALPYQGKDDLKLQNIYGNLIARIANAAFPNIEPLGRIKKMSGYQKKIVFISAHFRPHTIFKLFSAWLIQLGSPQCEIHALNTAEYGDREIIQLKAAGVIVHVDCHALANKIERLVTLQPDVIIFTDIGMDPVTQVIAGLRLAPQQSVAWGHPVTTGMPNIDSFLSSDLMEPIDGNLHYSEKLVRLPGLSINYKMPNMRHPRTVSLDNPILFCSQSLFKILPSQDVFFSRLLAELPKASLRLVAHDNKAITQKFHSRLKLALEKDKINIDERVSILPRVCVSRFLKLYSSSTVVLDTFKWSGGNTNLEALAMGVPIVTLPGKLMRSRHGHAMLQLLELPELIAKNHDDWVEIVIKSVTDHDWRQYLESRIQQNSHQLFNSNLWLRSLTKHIID